MITEHGIGKFTVQDVTEAADVALATAYNYFNSKEELISAAMETVMRQLAEKIEEATLTFPDPALIFPYGLTTVLTVMAYDERFRWLHQRPEALAQSIYHCFGPYAKGDIQKAVEAGRFHVNDLETVWRQVSWSIVGIALGISQDDLPQEVLKAAVINITMMLGVPPQEAADLFAKLPPPLDVS